MLICCSIGENERRLKMGYIFALLFGFCIGAWTLKKVLEDSGVDVEKILKDRENK